MKCPDCAKEMRRTPPPLFHGIKEQWTCACGRVDTTMHAMNAIHRLAWLNYTGKIGPRD